MKNIIKQNSKKGIKIELVLHPEVKNQLDSSTLQFMYEYTIFQIAPIPMRVIFVDNNEMILQIPGSETLNNMDLEDMNNVIIRLPDLVKTIERSIRSSINQVTINPEN